MCQRFGSRDRNRLATAINAPLKTLEHAGEIADVK